LASKGISNPTFENLKSAVVQGSVAASFTCEAFSTLKIQEVTQAHVDARIKELKGYTDFSL
jgi:hypothetical protein